MTGAGIPESSAAPINYANDHEHDDNTQSFGADMTDALRLILLHASGLADIETATWALKSLPTELPLRVTKSTLTRLARARRPTHSILPVKRVAEVLGLVNGIITTTAPAKMLPGSIAVIAAHECAISNREIVSCARNLAARTQDLALMDSAFNASAACGDEALAASCMVRCRALSRAVDALRRQHADLMQGSILQTNNGCAEVRGKNSVLATEGCEEQRSGDTSVNQGSEADDGRQVDLQRQLSLLGACIDGPASQQAACAAVQQVRQNHRLKTVVMAVPAALLACH